MAGEKQTLAGRRNRGKLPSNPELRIVTLHAVTELAWWWYPALFATGLTAGFVDAVAGGGGLLTVPVLLATGMDPKDALGTNKFQSACGTTVATWHYARHGLLQWATLRGGLLATLIGALAGAWAVTQISPDALRPVIPVLLAALAIYTWLKPDLGRDARPSRLPRPVFAVTFGLCLGFYDGFFGPGTGTFWTVACVLLLGLDLLAATAYTKAMNLTSNLASLAVFLALGHVRFGVGLSMAAGQMLGGRLGAQVAVQGGVRIIRPIFLTMVLALAAKLAWDSLR
jgi:uncharacterized membrane protein YfcA